MRGLLTLALVLLLAGAATGQEPGAAEACLDVVRRFTREVYAGGFVECLSLVRGVNDAEAQGPRFVQLIQDSMSSEAYRQLSDCGHNLFALAGVVETREGPLPARLEDLVGPGTPFPAGVPRCPAGGTYRYERKGGSYRIWCSQDAHALIGIRGDYPEFSGRGGLSLGDQALHLAPIPDFEVQDWGVEVEDFDEDLGLYRIRQWEKSRGDPRLPFRDRSSLFVLSSQDGVWRIDLALSNRDMVFIFDEKEWARSATIPRQVLFYYQLSESIGFKSVDVDDAAHLELRICEANLRSLSLVVEVWSVKHGGAYPESAKPFLTPEFLRELPRCPAGGQYRYRIEDPGSYRIWCEGGRHEAAGVPPGYPALTPVLGVMQGP